MSATYCSCTAVPIVSQGIEDEPPTGHSRRGGRDAQRVESLTSRFGSFRHKTGALGFALAALCVMAGIALVVAHDIGGLGLASCIVFALLFWIAALINVRWAVFLAFAFSLVQPVVTRLLFAVDFSDTPEQSMLDYRDPLTTFVSLLLVATAFLALAGHVSRAGRLASAGMACAVALYAILNFFEIFNPNQTLIVGVYGAKNNVLPVLMLFAGSLVVRTPEDTVRFVKFIAWFSVAALAYGLYQEVVGLPVLEDFWYSRTVDPDSTSVYLIFVGELEYRDPNLATSISLRVPSVFQGYTAYSYIIAAFGIVIYAAGRSFARGTWKLLRIAALGLLFLYFAFSMERSSIVMFGAGVLTVHFVRSRERKKFLRFLLLGTAAVAMSYAGFCYVAAQGVFGENPKLLRLGELTNPFTASTVGYARMVELWPKAIEEIKAQPLIGKGAGSGAFTRAVKERGQFVLPHNEYLHKLVELGPLGLFLFLLLLFFLYRRLIRKGTSEEESPVKRAFAAGMLGVLAAYVLCGLFNVPFLYEPGIVFWFLAGAALGTEQGKGPCSGSTEIRAAPAG